MIDTVDLKGKKVIFIDEICFGFPLDLERDNIPAASCHGLFAKALELEMEK